MRESRARRSARRRFSSRGLGRKRISRPALKLWDKSVSLLQQIDLPLPGKGLSRAVVAR